MNIRVPLTLGAIFACAFPFSASAELSLNKAQSLCKSEAYTQLSPAPTAVRVDRNSMKVEGVVFEVAMRVQNESGWVEAICSVDREAEEVKVTPKA